jgi:hypothetical protein
MAFAVIKVKVEESEMEGFTPPNSPKNCKSCILFAGLCAMMVLFYMTKNGQFL